MTPANSACSVSVRLPGIDLVMEGEPSRVTDALMAPYSAPSAGPAPWHLYRLELHVAVGVATGEPYGATRWVSHTNLVEPDEKRA